MKNKVVLVVMVLINDVRRVEGSSAGTGTELIFIWKSQLL